MKFYFKVVVALVLIPLLNSCASDDSLETTNFENQESKITKFSSPKNVSGVADLTSEFNQSHLPINKSSGTPPAYEANNGAVKKNYPLPNGPNVINRNLSFGSRAPGHTTQWIDVTVHTDVSIIDLNGVFSGLTNLDRGTVSFSLDGIGQKVN